MDLNSVKYREKFENYEIYPPPPLPWGKIDSNNWEIQKIEGSRNKYFTVMTMITFTIQDQLQRLLGKNDDAKWLTD